jgi:hypothetical protein
MLTIMVRMTYRQAFLRQAFLVTALGLAACLLTPKPALAHGHGHYKDGPRGEARGYYSKTVPRYIAVEQRGYYSPYSAGRIYYPKHHHYHVRYQFPVVLDGAVVFRPYVYCGDRLFVSGFVNLPQLALGVQYGYPGGILVGGYAQPYFPYYGR